MKGVKVLGGTKANNRTQKNGVKGVIFSSELRASVLK